MHFLIGLVDYEKVVPSKSVVVPVGPRKYEKPWLRGKTDDTNIKNIDNKNDIGNKKNECKGNDVKSKKNHSAKEKAGDKKKKQNRLQTGVYNEFKK